MTLPQLPQLPRISGDRNEGNKHLKNIETPEEDRDAATKKFVEQRGTFAASADAVSTGSITLKDSGGTDRKVMIKA